MITRIKNGRVICKDEIREGVSVIINDDRITGVFDDTDPAAPCHDTEIDAGGLYVSPGFVDIHLHGGGGADFLDCETDGFLKAAELHAKHGTTALSPTTTSGVFEELVETFHTYRLAKQANTRGADFLGLHLEGPYFSVNQRGAQDEKYVRPFEKKEYTAVLQAADGIVSRWSAAPELPGAERFAETMKKHGILAAMGHTDAEFEEAVTAFGWGFTHVTHLYSCTSTVHRVNAYRHCGVVEAAYLTDGMTVEIIADGCHLPPPLLRMIYRFKGPDKIALVTDAMRGAGMPEGESILGSKTNGLACVIEDGVAKMPDRTCFAGSVATADRLVRNMVSLAGVPLTDAVKMASATPARIIGATQKGALEAGKDADIVLFDDKINVALTMVKGKIVHTA